MKKGKRIFRVFVGFLALCLLWIFVAPFLAKNLIVEKKLDHPDVILVLGGSAAYLERTDKAAEIYKRGLTEKIYLTDEGTNSGWSKIEQRNIPFVELARRNLIARGVSPENIEILNPGANGTIYEARKLAEISKSENLKTILLVTSAYHTRRALRTFEHEFAKDNLPTEIGIESVSTESQIFSSSDWWFSSAGWNAVAGEYVKSVYYWKYY